MSDIKNENILIEVLKEKLNKVWVGLVIGLLAPLLTFFIIYLIMATEGSMLDFYNGLVIAESEIKLMTRCLVPDVVFFFLLIWINLLNAAKGFLMASIISILGIIALMMF